MSKPQSNLVLRITTALVILPIVLASIWTPGFRLAFTALVALIVAGALHEFYALLRAKDIAPHAVAGILAGIGAVMAAHTGNLQTLSASLVAGIALIGAVHVVAARPSATAITGTMAGFVYVGWFPAHVVLLHQREADGRGLVMLLVVAVVLTDTAAYFVGKSVGRHKLAPVISPKKTWEGAIGGLLFAIVAMLVVYALKTRFGWSPFPAWSPLRYAVTGAAVSVVAQWSDLLKSSIKRDAGVKDSGTVLPGHGGVLDRFDGFLFGAPILYYMAVF